MKRTFVLLASLAWISCSSSSSEDKGGEGGNGGNAAGGSSNGAGKQGGNSSTGGTSGGEAGSNGNKAGAGGSQAGTSGTAGSGGASTGGSGGSGTAGTGGGSAGNSGGGKAGGFLTDGIDGPAPTAPGCLVFKGKAFDFVSSHSDFQFPSDGEIQVAQTSFVTDTLGSDGNPVLGADFKTAKVASAASFKEWFTSTPAVNKVVDIEMTAAKRSPSSPLYAFGGDEMGWYPIDGKGQGNVDIVSPDVAVGEEITLDPMHNQLFSTKIEAQFYYQGGKNETLISESDDDSWIFINGKLAVENGGLHGFIPASVKLDEAAAKLGIKPGKHYPITFFYAERQFGAAKYRVTSNMLFSHCK
jgi:fibro-slime domain-containing protein